MYRILAISLILVCGFAVAGPAPYFRWGHPQDNLQICSQTAPGDGWVILKGPFKDGRCTQPGTLD